MMDIVASGQKRQAGLPSRVGAVLLGGFGVAAIIAVPAHAQSNAGANASAAVGTPPGAPDSQPAVAGQDIVVTAQKVQQRLLDVPVPVSAITSDALTRQNTVTIKDYFSRVPDLQYSGDRVQNLSIRGITTGGATNPTLAILVDDVPFGSSTASGGSNIPDFDPATLERIEVLRGPQGTLYGASSLGGLIKYVTRDPSTTDFSGHAEIGANTVSHGAQGVSMRGSVNVPLLSDHVGLSLSGFFRRDPPYVDNIDSDSGYLRRDANLSREWGGRAALVIKPVEALTINLSAIRQEARSSGSGSADFVSATDFHGMPDDLTVVRTPGQPSRSKFDLYSAKVNLDLGGVDLTSVSGWNVAVTTPLQDLTSIFGFVTGLYPPADTVLLVNAHHTTKFSQEVRLSQEGALLDWLVGGFYTVEHANIAQTMLLNQGSKQVAMPYDGSGPSTYREEAAFGDLTLHATSKLDIQVGARYAHNRQDNRQITTIDPAAVPIFGPSSSAESKSSDNAFTWLVTPSYHITHDLMVYLRVASGYRPGGTNSLVAGIPLTYSSDKVVNYELGSKGRVLGHKLDYDVSLFQIDWSKVQLQNTDSATEFTFTTNGGKARSRGVEATVTARAWRNATVTANGAYTDAVLARSLPVIANATGLSGNAGDRLPYTPKIGANFGFDQAFDLSATVQGFVGLNYTYVGNRYAEFINSDPGATGVRVRLPSYSQLDLHGGFTISNAWRLDAYIRNLTDKRGVLVASDRGGTSNNTGRYIQPRTIGFVVSADF